MAPQRIPVTPVVISWARDRAGFSLDEATRKFKKIADWEAGELDPTYRQLEGMAEAFKVPIAVFFFPDPPDVPPIKETFRTLPEAELENLPSRIKLLLRKAKAYQLSLSDLTGGRNFAERLITDDLRFRAEEPAEQIAERVRGYLGISVDQQRDWPSVDVALKAWRQCLFDVGVYVFKDQFRIEGYAGFCLTDEQFPIIYVNNSESKNRQIFTLFHELAHLLFHTSGIDSLTDAYVNELAGDARRIEVLCNRFAGVFLVPPAALADAIAGREISQETVQHIAREFSVSQLVIWRRLLDTGRIVQEAYDEVQRAADEAAPPAAEGGGGDYYYNQLAYLGRPYVELALSQYRQQRITAEQLAEHLNVKARNIPNLEERFLRGIA